MNDLDFCLEVVSRSCQPLRYIRRWISRKPLEIEAWFQRATSRKWHGLSNGHVTDNVTSLWMVNIVFPIRLERNISKTAGFRDSFPKDLRQEIAYWLSNGHVTDDVTWPQRCCEAVRSAILATAWRLIWYVNANANTFLQGTAVNASITLARPYIWPCATPFDDDYSCHTGRSILSRDERLIVSISSNKLQSFVVITKIHCKNKQ